MKLSNLKINTYAIILSIEILNQKVRRRLLELGFTPGTLIKITKIAPLGDPIGIYVRGYELCISKEEASYILVEVVK